MKRRTTLGPGLLVAAAFIGPGTLTTATKAGTEFGYTLAWAVFLSIAATLVLQEMSARLGLVTRSGLGEAIRSTFTQPIVRAVAIALVLAAIVFGNAAFEVGNVSGAALGLEDVTPLTRQTCIILVGVCALFTLASGTYRRIERLLVVLVAIMSVVFVTTAIKVGPDIGLLFSSLTAPSIPNHEGLLTIVALIGTTVVPYNLFLHASAVVQKWPGDVSTRGALRSARIDTALSILLGGLITLAVLITAAALQGKHNTVTGVTDMAQQLEPLLGSAAKYFFAVGLLAAGVTSAITAPLAAAFATAGVLGWNADLRTPRMRMVWASIVIVATGLALFWHSTPLAAIFFAQAANGLLLPLIALFLLVAVNRKSIMKEYTNRTWSNIGGVIAMLTTVGLGGWYIARALHIA